MKITIEMDLSDEKILAKVGDKKSMAAFARRLGQAALQLEVAFGSPSDPSQPHEPLTDFPDDPDAPCVICGKVHASPEDPPETCPHHGTVFTKSEGCPLCTELVRTSGEEEVP